MIKLYFTLNTNLLSPWCRILLIMTTKHTEKKVYTMTVSNSININKTNDHLSSEIILWMGTLRLWTYHSGIYNNLCHQCLSPLKFWVVIHLMVRCNRYHIIWYSLSVTCGRFVDFSVYSGFLHRHDVTQILLKVALNTIALTPRIMDNQYTIMAFNKS